MILKTDGTGFGGEHAAYGLERGGLARSVRADQRHDFPFLYLEGHILQRMDHAVIYIQFFYCEHSHMKASFNRPDRL